MATGAGLGGYVGAVLLLGGIAVAALNLGIRRLQARHQRLAKWEPAQDSHLLNHNLGGVFPNDSTGFFSGMASRSYSVPRDPQAYAKIFVPDAAEKDREE